MNNNQGNGGFLVGLLIGLIIGGGAVFLFGTKRGKKILKTLTEEGLDSVSELEDLFEDVVGGEDSREVPVQSEPRSKSPSPLAKAKAQPNGQSVQSPINKITSTGKRFFRRIPKRA